MSDRHDFLKRLRNDFECPESWDGMRGGDGCRFCASCQRQVFDFEKMTPRQIRSRLEAGRGKLCARLILDGGVPRTLAEDAPAPRGRRRGVFAGRSAPPAAFLLGAFLGFGAAAAQPAAPLSGEVGADLAAGGQRRSDEPARREENRGAGFASLSGLVVDPDGRPLAGVAVAARRVPDGRERQAVSGEDGRFAFGRLPAGIYDLSAQAAGFEVPPLSNLLLEPGARRAAELRAELAPERLVMGIVAMPRSSLRELFHDSELVAAAVVEDSEILTVENRRAEVATRLIVERRIKGLAKERRIVYRHSEYLHPDAAAGELPGGLHRGDEVLAFLVAAPDGGGPAAEPAFESVDFAHGLRRLAGAEREAYVERLEDLARLERGAGRPGGEDAAALMDWLVDGAEDPVTRSETLPEIAGALEAFAQLAKDEQETPAELRRLLGQALAEAGPAGGFSAIAGDDPRRPVFLGAAFGETHRQRLTAALAATESVTEADRALFALVRGWNRPAARRWAAKMAREAEIATVGEAYPLYAWLVELGEERAKQGSAVAESFAASAAARWEALGEMPIEVEADFDRRDQERLSLVRELMRELADLLEAAP